MSFYGRWRFTCITSILVCMLAHGALADTVFPGLSWQERTAAQVGLDQNTIDSIASQLGGDGVIVRNGYLVKKWGNYAGRGDWASAMKPVMSTMLFYAIEEGRIGSVDSLVRPVVQSHLGQDLVEKDRTMTWRHLADMTSGYTRGEAPGQAWAYNDYAINLYSILLFDGVFGDTPDNVSTSRLSQLQFQDGGLFGSRGGRGLNASPRDFARIGWLWANYGNWAGTQLLPRSYFENYMKPDVPVDLPRTWSSGSDYLGTGTIGGDSNQTQYGPGVYGFNWWFNGTCPNGNLAWPAAPSDTLQANGHWGVEVITVIPSLGIVVACRGNWGTFAPGDPNASMNHLLGRLAGAVSNIPPQAQSQQLWMEQPGSLSITLEYLDDDGPGPYTFSIVTPPAHGQLAGSGGTVSYSPENSFSGTDSFQWSVNDGLNQSNIATVTIEVDPAGNQAPVAIDEQVSTFPSTGVEVRLQFDDPDGPEPFMFDVLSNPGHGVLSGNGEQRTYTPSDGYLGTDSFTWRVTDALGAESNVATCSISVSEQLEISDTQVASGRDYVWDRLSVGKAQYIDRGYTFTSVASGYDDMMYLLTANDDKLSQSDPFLRFVVNQPVRVYVAYDRRVSHRPSWLADWTDTGSDLVTQDTSFGLLLKKFDAGLVELGPNACPADGCSMYTVVVAALGTPTPGQIIEDPEHPARMIYHDTTNSVGPKPVIMCGPGDPEDFFYNNTRADLDLLVGRGARATYITAYLQDFGGGFPGTADALDRTLDDWDAWISELEAAGVITVFFFFDDSQPLPALWQDSVDRIVNRLKHHRLLVWSVAEEYSEALSSSDVAAVAARIKAADEFGHVVGVHELSSTSFDFNSNPDLEMFLMQLPRQTPEEVHASVLSAWNNTQGLKILDMSEMEDHGKLDRGTVRKVNWAAIMAGASAVQVIWMGRASDDPAWNEQARYDDCARLEDFFEATNVNSMVPRDDLALAGSKWVLSDDSSFIVYSPELSGDLGIKAMPEGA